LILEKLGPDDCLFVVSDHGFQGATCAFDINEYLYSKGLLALNASFQQQQTVASRRASLKHTLNQMGLLALARKVKKNLAGTGIVKRTLSQKDRPVLSDSDIDWERTLAYVPSHSGFGGGYADIFLSNDFSDERLAELRDDLKRQVHPRTGQPLIDAIYTEEVFGTGPYAPRERHLLLLPTGGFTFRMSLGNKRFWDDMAKTRGTHQKDGVLYAYGGSFKSGLRAPNAEIYDLVPTVLHSMGLAFPDTFDGCVLQELFVAGKQAGQTAAADISTKGGIARLKLSKLLEA
jgi:predicted AlkP superfamily phosphohydrolase/phosphomutase